MLSVESVVKRYENVLAVDSLSFQVEDGQIFGLLGPNGAGKSTTIRMIMNIIAPDSGKILLDGRSLGRDATSRIGYLPEERGLYRKARVGEILEYLATLKGADPAASRKSIDLWLERFGLGEWKNRKVSELSKGMAQKAQFIGAVAHDPSLILFDEPFSGLDPLAQEELLSAMVELKDKGAIVIFSTHIMEHAEKICEKILLINKGGKVAEGGLAEIKGRYGKNAVQLEFDGDPSFIQKLPFVTEIISYPRWIEVELSAPEDSARLLAAVAGQAGAGFRLRRFETVAPSLHKIFLRLAGKGGEDA